MGFVGAPWVAAIASVLMLGAAGSAVFGKMSMQDFGSRGTVAVGGLVTELLLYPLYFALINGFVAVVILGRRRLLGAVPRHANG